MVLTVSASITRPSFEEAWRRRFEGFAHSNDDDAGIAGWSSTGLETRLRYFARFWDDRQPQTLWLDVGCGAGTYTRFLAAHKIKVVGLDYSLPAITKAKARDVQSNYWGVADVKNLPLKSNTFDGVLCFGVMQALTDSTPAVSDLYRVVKPEGCVWLDALNAWCLPHLLGRLLRWASKRPIHLRYESPSELKRIMESAGFDSVQLYWLPILPSRWQRFQSLLESGAVMWCLRNIPFLCLLLSHSILLKGTRPSSG